MWLFLVWALPEVCEGFLFSPETWGVSVCTSESVRLWVAFQVLWGNLLSVVGGARELKFERTFSRLVNSF